MNYHLLIDHWFLIDFIQIAETVAPNNNTYLFTFSPPAKHLKSELGFFTPYGSKELNEIVDKITLGDRVFIHWFHEPVIDVLNKLHRDVPVYLPFWGGDFLGYTKELTDFNFDRLTKKYLRRVETIEFYLSPKKYIREIVTKVKERRRRKPQLIHEINIRKLLMQRLNFFCHWNPLDKEIVVSQYGGNAEYLPFFYDPMLNSIHSNASKKVDNSDIVVWLGNSDTPTNNHLDAIQALAKFKSNNIKVICPLSYGISKNYAEVITNKGIKLFNEKWNSISEFVSLVKYRELQKNVDVVVMYHNRTQAAGNVMAFIKMGKKVFLKSQSTLYSFLKRKGITVFDSNAIWDLKFEEFSAPLTHEQIKSNVAIISNEFSTENKLNLYKRILGE